MNLFSDKTYYVPRNPEKEYKAVEAQVDKWLEKFQGERVKVSYIKMGEKIRVFVERATDVKIYKDF